MTAFDGNGIDVEVAIALADEGEGFSVRGPAVQIRRRMLGDAARSAASEGKDVDERVVILLRRVADGQGSAVWRD